MAYNGNRIATRRDKGLPHWHVKQHDAGNNQDKVVERMEEAHAAQPTRMNHDRAEHDRIHEHLDHLEQRRQQPR